MTIYTKTGDKGETGLFGGGRVSKDDARVEAYGGVDELNAAVGLARSLGLPKDLDALALRVQEQLFTVGAVLATPVGTKASTHIPQIQAGWAVEMEKSIDAFDQELGPLTQFILPGGSTGAGSLHFARTVCRRAERKVVSLHRTEQVGDDVVLYLNRLSDFLFTLA
ncbi:MAG: cob(I)yrinic acid a,c-diamide adenosyltransferase, partial [Myxococcaceae bacterium]